MGDTQKGWINGETKSHKLYDVNAQDDTKMNRIRK